MNLKFYQIFIFFIFFEASCEDVNLKNLNTPLTDQSIYLIASAQYIEPNEQYYQKYHEFRIKLMAQVNKQFEVIKENNDKIVYKVSNKDVVMHSSASLILMKNDKISFLIPLDIKKNPRYSFNDVRFTLENKDYAKDCKISLTYQVKNPDNNLTVVRVLTFRPYELIDQKEISLSSFGSRR